MAGIVAIPGPRMERETPGQRPRPNYGHPQAGPTKIHGAEVAMEGIRAGFGLAVAAVMATGDSLLSGVHHLERGYDSVLDKFRQLGADIDVTHT